MEFQLATRPVASSVSLIKSQAQKTEQKPISENLKGRQVSLLTNYYKFEFQNPDKKSVYKYHVKFTPELSDNSKKVRCKLVNGLRDKL